MRPACAPRWGFYIRRALTKNVKIMRPGRAWVQKTPGARAERPPCPHPPVTPPMAPSHLQPGATHGSKVTRAGTGTAPHVGDFIFFLRPRLGFYIRRALRAGGFTFFVRPTLGVLHSSCAPHWGRHPPPPTMRPVLCLLLLRADAAHYGMVCLFFGGRTLFCVHRCILGHIG